MSFELKMWINEMIIETKTKQIISSRKIIIAKPWFCFLIISLMNAVLKIPSQNPVITHYQHTALNANMQFQPSKFLSGKWTVLVSFPKKKKKRKNNLTEYMMGHFVSVQCFSVSQYKDEWISFALIALERAMTPPGNRQCWLGALCSAGGFGFWSR